MDSQQALPLVIEITLATTRFFVHGPDSESLSEPDHQRGYLQTANVMSSFAETATFWETGSTSVKGAGTTAVMV